MVVLPSSLFAEAAGLRGSGPPFSLPVRVDLSVPIPSLMRASLLLPGGRRPDAAVPLSLFSFWKF